MLLCRAFSVPWPVQVDSPPKCLSDLSPQFLTEDSPTVHKLVLKSKFLLDESAEVHNLREHGFAVICFVTEIKEGNWFDRMLEITTL
jgi:hypothetical protein